MLLVSASVKPSLIHGYGCFTNEPIKKGQVVWDLDERMDMLIPLSEVPSLPESAQSFLYMYGYMTMRGGEKVFVLCGDHAKHMNHSEDPNLIEYGDHAEYDIALRDIEAGEELTCNYYHFDLDVDHKLGKTQSVPQPHR